MTAYFDSISPAEFDKLKHSVAWVALLIAGADGHIDSEELSWASKIAKIRAYSNPEVLNEFYEAVAENFDEYLEEIIENSPKDGTERTQIAIEKLAEINPILAKLPTNMGYSIYNSLLSFAKHVAKASGGFLRMWSISYEENKYIKLPMITPIIHVEDGDLDEAE